MKVRELIEALKDCDQDREVVLFSGWDNYPALDSVARESGENGDKVMLGHNLPAELFGEDYRSERG